MSQFKKGDKVVRVGLGHRKLEPGREYVVSNGNVAPASTGEWITLEGVVTGEGDPWEFLSQEFALAPAGPDPSKVKVGDTVRLEDGLEADADYAGGKVTYVGRDGEQAVRGVWAIRIKGLGVFEVGPHKWTLTDHQPAPEPGPEWEPGTQDVAFHGALNKWALTELMKRNR